MQTPTPIPPGPPPSSGLDDVADVLRDLGRRVLGRPADWHLPPRVPHPPRVGVALVGPLSMLVSVAGGWLAFVGTRGEGDNVGFGLFIGSVAIMLMAWSFVLALRVGALEPLFGGLDRMYRAHRWAGALSVVAMYLHTAIDPEIEGGVRGASERLADQTQELAHAGEIMLYALVFLTLVRLFPYRVWRLTHKLLGIPFAFSCLHFFTADKPYANGSGWGWWFGGWMVAGFVAWILRVVGKDMVARGARYEVSRVMRRGYTVDLRLRAIGRPLRHRAGQFAAVKLGVAGLSEPHMFSIASPPGADELRFVIRDLGDWTREIVERNATLVGSRVRIEGPFGGFRPLPDHPVEGGRVVWVAGGSGITPFLSAVGELPAAATGRRPVLIYCVPQVIDVAALEELEAAAADNRIDLVLRVSSAGERFGPATLEQLFGPAGLTGAHVASCGPAGLVATADRAARALGAVHVEREDFDIRQGFGPDVSRELDDARRFVTRAIGSGR